MAITAQDIREFNAYLAALTDKQVRGIHEYERAANREEYAALVEQEAIKRGIDLS